MHPLPLDPESVKGFMPASEGAELYRAVSLAPPALPCLEIGSYCGKSTIYLGAACQRSGRVLFAVDHHAGSEEHQPGEGYFDPELASADGQGVDTFGAFRRTLRGAALEDTVVPIVAPSAAAARAWATPWGSSLSTAVTAERRRKPITPAGCPSWPPAAFCSFTIFSPTLPMGVGPPMSSGARLRRAATLRSWGSLRPWACSGSGGV